MTIMRLPLTHPVTRSLFAGLLAVSVAACAPSIAGTDAGTNPGGNSQTGGNSQNQTTGKVTTTSSNGVYTTVVDADVAKADTFTYFSFATGKEVEPADPAESTDWHLKFKASNIFANSGDSGSGNVVVKRVTGVSFDSLTTAPTSGYIKDAADGDDDGSAPDNGFHLDGNWYEYNTTTHVITPKADHVYIVRTGRNQFYKMQITNYYDAAGTARYVTFKWAELATPFKTTTANGVNTTILDAGAYDGTAYTYYSFTQKKEVTVANPEDSADWDVAFLALNPKVNGGVHGTGGVELLRVTDDFDTLSAAPNDPFITDSKTGETTSYAFRNGDGWASYSSGQVTIRSEAVYIVKGVDGKYYKLKALNYYDDDNTARIVTFKWGEIAGPDSK